MPGIGWVQTHRRNMVISEVRVFGNLESQKFGLSNIWDFAKQPLAPLIEAMLHVFLKLRGLPSVMTTTMDFASLRPRDSSAFAVINAKDVRVLPEGQVRA